MSTEGKGIMRGGAASPLVACLEMTPCDEIVEYDLINNRCRNLRHTDGKYFVPVMDSSLDAMNRFAPENMIHPEDRDLVMSVMAPDTLPDRLRNAAVPGILQLEARYKLLDGTYHWTRQVLIGGEEAGLPQGVVRTYIYDIQAEKELSATPRPRTQVHRDERTGLLMERDLFAMINDRRDRITGQWCVIAIDIEHFKLFTDWHGRDAGDMLLAQIGKTLRQMEADTHGLAGYRGLDDFWLVMPFNQQLINDLYERIRDLIISHGNSVGFLPIFGISLFDPSSGEAVTDLFNHAALTAEQVKGDLHNRVRIYNPAASMRTAEEYRLLSDFQRALDNHEIFFCLQPQCRVSTGNVVGAESLARWRMKDGTMVPPTRFVPILEKYKMVTNLDKYIWEGVCRWLKGWIDRGHKAVPISVNISQSDILTIDVPDYLAMLLKKYDLPPQMLKVEITESAYAQDTAAVRDTVRRLRDMGLLVMMDDFGSGYSSLNMLRSLNVDVIKLDAQFLHISAQEERKGISILESIVNMAKSMSLPIIVEGVETQEQINFLSDMGCRYMQGYYFYRAMPVEEFERLIGDESQIDLRGFEFKATEQIHPREFLDENVFSDAMLNNILGPVAIYRMKGESVDIVRYNQQFYQMVGISIDQLNERRNSIESFMYAEDREKLFHIFTAASQDRLNGAKGVLRVYRPNGSLRWISMQVYFLSETQEGKTFYGSCEDVTELQFINVDLPGAYHRCFADENLEFRYVSKNFLEMTGYSEAEIQKRFGNQLIRMIHPEDTELIRDKIKALLEKRRVPSDPFRLCRKQGDYIWVVSHQIITDLYGDLCFMAVANDVTELMTVRNNLRLLEKYSTDCIAFVHHKEKQWYYEALVYGLQDHLGLSRQEFFDALNEGAMYGWVEEPQRSRLRAETMTALQNGQGFETTFDLRVPEKGIKKLHMKGDVVRGSGTSVDYICVFQALL